MRRILNSVIIIIASMTSGCIGSQSRNEFVEFTNCPELRCSAVMLSIETTKHNLIALYGEYNQKNLELCFLQDSQCGVIIHHQLNQLVSEDSAKFYILRNSYNLDSSTEFGLDIAKNGVKQLDKLAADISELCDCY